MSPNDRELGEHDERLKSLEREMSDTRTDIKEILQTLHEAKGGYRTLMLVGGMAGAVGALIGKFLPWLNFKP